MPGSRRKRDGFFSYVREEASATTEQKSLYFF